MSEDRCAICFDDLEDEYIKTRCGHKFCEDCIKKIEPVKDPNDSKKNIIQCPLCRTPIDIAVRISKNKGKNIPEAISIKQKLPIETITETITENKENFGNSIKCDDVIKEIKLIYKEKFEIDEALIRVECEKHKIGGRTKRARSNKKKSIKKRRINKIKK
jgi:hypothetical protein